jgi:L-methionine (R)-S-oxide reductase
MSNKNNDYELMFSVIESYLENERNEVAILANICATINVYMDDINWVGFYILEKTELVLGPFQGEPACVRIQVGSGVCGNAVQLQEAIIVNDVSTFKGYIACDDTTKSELVVPIMAGKNVYGVLDIDSPIPSRFGALEKITFNKVAEAIGNHFSKQHALNNMISSFKGQKRL